MPEPRRIMVEVNAEELKKLQNGLKPTEEDVVNFLIEKGTLVRDPSSDKDVRKAHFSGTKDCGIMDDPFGKKCRVIMDYEARVEIKYESIKEPF